jgi:hypothetical protein
VLAVLEIKNGAKKKFTVVFWKKEEAFYIITTHAWELVVETNKILIPVFLTLGIVLGGAASFEKEFPWKVTVASYKGGDVLKVFDKAKKDKKPIMEYSSKSATTGFKEYQIVRLSKLQKDFLITRWIYGAHSETLRIFDPTQSKPLIFELITSWPAEFEIQEDGIKILIPSEKFDGDAQPSYAETYWRPQQETNDMKDSLKEPDPSTSPAPQNPSNKAD